MLLGFMVLSLQFEIGELFVYRLFVVFLGFDWLWLVCIRTLLYCAGVTGCFAYGDFGYSRLLKFVLFCCFHLRAVLCFYRGNNVLCVLSL